MTCAGAAEIVFVADAPSCPAKVSNLSVEGCLLVAERPVDLFKEALVELAFTVNQLPFRVRAQVKAVRSETEYGFQFVLLSDRSKRRLEELMEELREHHLNLKRGDSRTKPNNNLH